MPYKEHINIADINIDNLINDNVIIESLAITCNFNTIIDCENVFENFVLNKQNLVFIEFNNEFRKIKNFYDKKIDKLITRIRNLGKNDKKKTKKNYNKSFNNQVTLYLKINECQNIHCKLFQNGSIQICGVKTIFEFNQCISYIIDELSSIKYKMIDNKFDKIDPFITDPIKLTDFKINLISTVVKFGFKISLHKLLNVLYHYDDNFRIDYDACKSKSLRFSINTQNNETNCKGDLRRLSFFIFENGKIILSSCKNREEIIYGYNFITSLLLKHKHAIIKLDVLNLYKSFLSTYID